LNHWFYYIYKVSLVCQTIKVCSQIYIESIVTIPAMAKKLLYTMSLTAPEVGGVDCTGAAAYGSLKSSYDPPKWPGVSTC
jgi:hypothetical protein